MKCLNRTFSVILRALVFSIGLANIYYGSVHGVPDYFIAGVALILMCYWVEAKLAFIAGERTAKLGLILGRRKR